MTRAVPKMHLITGDGGPDKVFTACGREGWKTAMQDEYETARGDRFEALENRNRTTCKACLSAVDRQP